MNDKYITIDDMVLASNVKKYKITKYSAELKKMLKIPTKGRNY